MTAGQSSRAPKGRGDLIQGDCHGPLRGPRNDRYPLTLPLPPQGGEGNEEQPRNPNQPNLSCWHPDMPSSGAHAWSRPPVHVEPEAEARTWSAQAPPIPTYDQLRAEDQRQRAAARPHTRV